MVPSSRPSQADTHTRSRLGRSAAAASLALLLTAACGQDNRPGVTVTNAQSDVVFGIETTKPAPPVTAQPPNLGPQGPAPAPLPPAPSLPDPPGFNNGGTPPPDNGVPGRINICREPPLFASAPEPASIFVKGQPKMGFQLWQLITQKDLGNNIKTKTVKYANYQVRNVSAVTSRANPAGGPPTETFTYDMLMPVGGGNVRTITYQVKQNAIVRDVSTVIGRQERLGEPDAGVSIKKEVLRDSAGKVLSTFEPLTPVLILPLPIAGGSSFTGSGTDPVNGGQLTVNGTVVGPSRVTACGGFLQGYRVEATVSSTSGGASTTSTQAFTIETQSGGLVVNAEVTPTGATTTQIATVGETVPRVTATTIPKDQAL